VAAAALTRLVIERGRVLDEIRSALERELHAILESLNELGWAVVFEDYAAASVLSVLELKKPEDIDDQTLILADVSHKAIAQVGKTGQDLLAERMSLEQASSLAEKLSSGTWPPVYPITAEEGKSLGVPTSTEMPAEVYAFMRLFPQPMRNRPSVEYVPARYGRDRQSLMPRQP